MIRDGYLARWQGNDYEAAPDEGSARLYLSTPEEGFSQVRPDRYVRVVPLAEVSLSYLRTTCTWRGEPFLVLAEYEGWLRVEYTGGKAPVAQALELEELEYGVYQGWVRVGEVTDVREHLS